MIIRWCSAKKTVYKYGRIVQIMCSSEERTKMNVVIIGLGHWGPNHLRVFSTLSGTTVLGAADISEARTRSFAEKYPTLLFSNDYRELLREDVDAVIVATPSASHYAIVKDALLAGKHVLCEKPLTTNPAEAWELVRLADGCGKVLMVGHIFMYNPGIRYLAELIRNDVLGEIYYAVGTRTNLGPFRYDVNAAWDLISHDIYIMNYFFNSRPERVSAVGGCYLSTDNEDVALVNMIYPGGRLAHVHASWLSPRKVRQLSIIGKKKMALWDDLGAIGPVMLYDRTVIKEMNYETFGEFQLLAREGDLVVPKISQYEPLTSQAVEFLHRCGGVSEAMAEGSAREGAEVVDILMTLDQSLKSKSEMVEVKYGA
ncbi:MAG: Gfo/Idh/MocA family oxidoreductase [Verrucomicrobiae bacterium]|nr:Gfo/Idh/MocA family oxidoreductase [Verrucomicrobiae bacterium]